MRRDPTKDKEFHDASAWGNDRIKMFEKEFVPGEGFVLKMNPLSGGERNRLFLRRGDNFEDVSLLSGADTRKDGRGFVLLDYDQDGWMDIAIASPNRPKFQLFRNKIGDALPDNRFLTLKLVGGHNSNLPTSEWSATDAYGARILVTCGDTTRMFEHTCGEGISSQNSVRIHVGLGTAEQADSIRITWPSGRVSTLEDIKAGSETTIHERDNSQMPTVHP